MTEPCGKIRVTFRVTGFDHTGYCSDADVTEIEPYVTEITQACEWPMHDFNPTTREYQGQDLDTLDFVATGCTSGGGSGYCQGCEQYWTALKAFATW